MLSDEAHPPPRASGASIAVRPMQSSSSDIANRSIQLPNKGGRPEGSTNKNKWLIELRKKQAVNWVTESYEAEQKKAAITGVESEKLVQVEKGTRMKLVKEAKSIFKIDDNDLDVPRQTIHSRIKSGNLEVWHTGSIPPLLEMEVVLKSYLLMASSLHSALSVTKAISLAKSLIKGTKYEQTFIAWKKTAWTSLPRNSISWVCVVERFQETEC